MIYYLLKRLLFAFPVLFGINLITFVLFFIVNSPDDMARMQLGQKYVKPIAITQWKVQHGYDLPLFYNEDKPVVEKVTQTLFFQKSLKLFTFNFGLSDSGRDIGFDIIHRMGPSLMIAVPVLLAGMVIEIIIAMVLVFFRYTFVDVGGLIACILIMSISSLFYIIGGQYLFSKLLRLVPISGYDSGWQSFKFVILPIVVAILSGLGSGVRWYRSLFIEEMSKGYVKTARSKGLRERAVFFNHVLRNVMLPVLTGVVVLIPSLFMGSLVLESFFGVPGLGSYMIDAIQQQDFAIVRTMVFLGSILYIGGLILTDVSYTWADPRVRL
ncbi:MAG: ABC transporter permease [Silvanigrellaceae bacterium]|nr:ABC transporter permease [Silvanigrellaceae bacterium]